MMGFLLLKNELNIAHRAHFIYLFSHFYLDTKMCNYFYYAHFFF